MSIIEQLLAEKEEATRETQAVISRGEELLDRAHEVAHEIEEMVRRVDSLDESVIVLSQEEVHHELGYP